MKINIKYIWKILRKTILFLVSAILIYMVVAIVLSCISTNPEIPICEDQKAIYIATNGVHLNIIIENDDLPSDLRRQLEIPAGTPYISFGWGDRGFYLYTPTWSDLKFSTAFKALFLKSSTAMQVMRYPGIQSSWYKLKLCDSQVAAVNDFIRSSFRKDSSNNIVKIDFEGYSPHDDFYEAEGIYTVFYTSNNWVNEALKKANVKTAIWSPFDEGVLYHLNRQEN